MKHLNAGRRLFAGFAVLGAAAFVGIALLRATTAVEASIVTSGSLILCGTVTWASSFERARRSCGRRRAAWFTLSFGAVCGVLANTWWMIVRLSSLPNTWRRALDPLLLVALVFCVIGLWLFPPVGRSASTKIRIMLDGLVIGGSVLFVTSVWVFPQLLRASSADTLLGRGQVLFLPVMDALIATLAALLITRTGRASRVPLILLGAGFVPYALADLSYAINSSQHAEGFGSVGDLGWVAGYLLFALAARHPTAGVNPTDESHRTSPVLGTVVVFGVFFGAAAVCALASLQGEISASGWIIWLVVLLAMMGRQVALLVNNEHLRQNLEHEVSDRTRELHGITREQHLLLASVGDGIYRVDRFGVLTFVNAAASALLRRSPDDLVGHGAHELFHAPQGDGRPFPLSGCYITEAITSGLTVSGEEDHYVRGDDSVITVEATASPLQDEDVISGAVVVFRDVSQRREIDRLKGEFVSIVSHELRTPLTSIRGSLGLMAGGAFGVLPTQAARMMEIAVAGTDRLTRLINDILDIERIESGTMPMTVTTESVRALCEEARAAVAGVSAQTGVEIVLGPCPGSVLADRDRIVQTLINLLGNAIKFSPRGAEVRIEAVPTGDLVEIAVHDQGRGIPADKLEAIFGRFSQVDSSDARDKGGTGLGLAISRSIVERLGGTIWATSEVGVGSSFRFTLPGAPPAETRAELPIQDTEPMSYRDPQVSLP